MLQKKQQNIKHGCFAHIFKLAEQKIYTIAMVSRWAPNITVTNSVMKSKWSHHFIIVSYHTSVWNFVIHNKLIMAKMFCESQLLWPLTTNFHPNGHMCQIWSNSWGIPEISCLQELDERTEEGIRLTFLISCHSCSPYCNKWYTASFTS